MKRMITLMVMTAVLFCPPAATVCRAGKETPESVKGFKTVPFGTPYQEVRNYLEREFPGRVIDAGKPNTLVLKQFDLNGLPVDVLFAFNRSGKFSGFSFFTRLKGRQYDDEVMRDHTMLRNAFKVKYGEMYVCKDSLNVFDGVQCSWRDTQLTIVTGFKGTDWEYCAYGFVESKKMAREDVRQEKTDQKAKSAPSPF